MKRQSTILILWSIIWITSCQEPVAQHSPEATLSTPIVTLTATTPSTEIAKPISTATLEPPTPTQITMPIQVDQALPDVFTTPTSEADSAWRPPLYPVPWIPTPYDHFLFSRPIAAREIKWALANYRYGGVFVPGVVHTGIDIPVKTGTQVYAGGPGRVVWVGYGLLNGQYNPDDPYGQAVEIRHDFGYQGQTLYTVYGHMSRIDVTRGQHVESGDVLGLTGATGHVTGPHLHFEVRIGQNNFSRSRNPELWISPPQGWGVLAGRVTDGFGEELISKVVTIRSIATGKKWTVNTYGAGSVNSDPYYRENVAIGDLPAGNYSIWILDETTKHAELVIYPGRVSYFTFIRGQGFATQLPPAPRLGFSTPAPPITPIPTP
jgi:murein DD-endopeptidase MepM/ murein hydrolase activator NlpD